MDIFTFFRPRLQSAIVRHFYSREFCVDPVMLAGGLTDGNFCIGTVLGKITASGKYAPFEPAAFDGSQHAAAVLFRHAKVPAGSDTPGVAIVRGPAVLAADGLAWRAPTTAAEQAAAISELAVRGLVLGST